MTRLGLAAVALALAVGPSMAVPSTTPVENQVHPYSEMSTYQEGSAPGAPEDTTTTTTSSPVSDGAEQWLESFVRAVQRQLQLQDQMMRQLMRDIQEYLSTAFNWAENQSTAYTRVTEMMDMISNRMNAAMDSSNELMTTSDTTDPETLRRATRKYMKEVRVQDVLVDALWASLRGVQTAAWMNGVTAIEKEETTPMASRAAEEFLHRMYHNLRAAGMSEEDVAKFIPRAEYNPSEQSRNMGRKGRSFYYGGYPSYYNSPYYSYSSYPSYYNYSYPSYSYSSYPSYYRYSSYPYYNYSYPSYYNYGSYPYYSYSSYPSWYWRRLRSLATATCPDCPPLTTPSMIPTPPPMMNMMNTPPPMANMMTSMMMNTPMVPPPRTLGTEAMSLGLAPIGITGAPMTGFGVPPEFGPFGAEGIGLPTDALGSTPEMTPFDPTTPYRTLAPMDLPPIPPPVFPETPMRPPTPFGFGPAPVPPMPF
uniref:56 kDa gametocyte antigen n=1 Tax=Eimeria maxima TaxID=5804 RepID=Q8I1K3_EIMMA|nr:56 kDa gametocyte antigen [Eimeria maxima]